VIAFPTKGKAAKVPAALAAEKRAVWDSIVETFAPGHFLSIDEGLLEVNCAARILWRRANQKIEQLTAKGKKIPGYWLRVRAQTFSELMTTGDRLGIGPGKRTTSIAAALEAKRFGTPAKAAPCDKLFFGARSKR
jgi:hypothetical protein